MKISKQKLERIIKEEVAREMRMREEEGDPLEELAGQILNPDMDRVLYGKNSKAIELLGRGSKDAPEAFETLMMYIRDKIDDMLSYAEPT